MRASKAIPTTAIIRLPLPKGIHIPKDTTRLLPLVRLRYLAIAQSGKNLRIAVIPQIEHAGETCGCVSLFIPKAIFALLFGKIRNPARTAACSTSPAAINPSKAHAVCEAVLGAVS